MVQLYHDVFFLTQYDKCLIDPSECVRYASQWQLLTLLFLFLSLSLISFFLQCVYFSPRRTLPRILNLFSKMLGVNKMLDNNFGKSTNVWYTNIMGSTIWGVKFVWAAKTEPSACSMGK